MADITVTASSVDAARNAVIIRATAGAALTAGQVVYLDGANGWKPADADAEASAQAKGVVYRNAAGGTSVPSGGTFDLVTHGPVTFGSGMTPGAPVYVSTTAGACDQTAPATAGDFPYVVGYAMAADVLYVSPQTAVPTANS